MMTSESPPHVIKLQADNIAARLKAAERRDPTADQRFAAVRDKEWIVFAIVMDDKFLKIEMTWTLIHDMTEAAISEYIIKHMQGAKEQ